MTLDEIKRLIEFIREQDLSEFELEHDGMKLRVKSGRVMHASDPEFSTTTAPPSASVSAPAIVSSAPASSVPTTTESAPEEEGTELAIVKSPIVGTFYRAPEPAASHFVEVGDTVKKGQVLCIIEAMKLMNEIDSEYDGEIVNIYVENGQAVQYGERLFAIRLRS
jgi:acetyl-CoA carboxylase biotin carboxyl carrier protein